MTRIPFALSLLLFCAHAIAAEDLTTLGGKTVTGTLEKITANDIVVNGAATPIAQALILNVRPGKSLPAAERFFEVQLTDDYSLLRCTKITYGAKESQLELTTGVTLKLPNSALLTILRDAEKQALKDQWAKLLKSKKRVDRIFVVRDGDLNSIEGAFGAIDEAKQTIQFKPDAAPQIEPALEKLQGMQFARTDAAPEGNQCKVIDIDGNLIVAAKLVFDGAKFTVTTPYGQTATFDGKLIARVDYNLGRLIYLSDLDAKLAPSAFLGGFNPVRKNLNLDGNPIMLADKQYPKGLSIYAGAELEYDLGKKYKKFTALLGADSRIAEEGQGKVTVAIYCDREKRFTEVVSTKAPLPISVDVKDVSTLKIVVSGTNFTNFAGHATLANAQVSE